MSFQSKKEAKRLFEILKEMEVIFTDFHGQYNKQVFIVPLHTEEDIIQKLAEAIAIYKAEELEEMFKMAKKRGIA